jgi:hypothetical protein
MHAGPFHTDSALEVAGIGKLWRAGRTGGGDWPDRNEALLNRPVFAPRIVLGLLRLQRASSRWWIRIRAPQSQPLRVHQEDLCQALALPPSLKYQNEGGPGPANIAKLLRCALPAQAADDAVRRFADALIWNWLIAGTDAHAKNYSLLLAQDQVRLAPLYDVASALPSNMHEWKLRFAMKIGGDYRVFPCQNIWPEAARELALDADALVGRVRVLAAKAPDVFADAAKAPDVDALDRPLPTRLVDLIAARSARCSQLVGGSAPAT